jgi:hypothetical protein
MNAELLTRIAEALLILSAVIPIPMMVWIYKAKPPRQITKRYPWRIVYFSHVPFTSAWKKQVSPDDVVVFERYQTRLNIGAVLALLISNMISAAAYLHVVALCGRLLAPIEN